MLYLLSETTNANKFSSSFIPNNFKVKYVYSSPPKTIRFHGKYYLANNFSFIKTAKNIAKNLNVDLCNRNNICLGLYIRNLILDYQDREIIKIDNQNTVVYGILGDFKRDLIEIILNFKRKGILEFITK